MDRNKRNYQQKKSKNDSIILYQDGDTITDQKIISNKFNNFFTNIAQELVKKLPANETHFMNFLNQPLHKCFYLKPIEQSEIRDIIKGMDATKSSDIFGIPPKMLKLSEPVISPLLKEIFNESFTSGVFPSTLKFAKILPTTKVDQNYLLITIDLYLCYQYSVKV